MQMHWLFTVELHNFFIGLGPDRILLLMKSSFIFDPCQKKTKHECCLHRIFEINLIDDTGIHTWNDKVFFFVVFVAF